MEAPVRRGISSSFWLEPTWASTVMMLSFAVARPWLAAFKPLVSAACPRRRWRGAQYLQQIGQRGEYRLIRAGAR